MRTLGFDVLVQDVIAAMTTLPFEPVNVMVTDPVEATKMPIGV